MAGLQVVDEQPAGPQVAAADLQHPHAWLQPVADRVVELELADLQPRLVRIAADSAVAAAGRVRAHHRPVVADVVSRPQLQPGIASAPPRMPGDPARVADRVAELEREPG